MGRCFFVPKREGVIEKYINEKKGLDVSEKHRTFAGLDVSEKHRTFAVDFKKNTK